MEPQLDIYPAPDVSLVLVPQTTFERNRAFFHENFSDLFTKYKDKYVAIHNGQVVAVGATLLDTAFAAYEKCGHVAVFVDLVTDQPRMPERISSPLREPML